MANVSQIPKRIINNALRRVGYQISRTNTVDRLSLEAALVRLQSKNPPIAIETVIDVGASDGRWARKVMKHYPSAHYLLIEANKVHQEGLERFKQEYANADYVLAVAGHQVGETYFDDSDPMGGSTFLRPVDRTLVKLPLTTIDSEVAARGLKPPYLIKLDTHGFEVPILEGAQQVLESTNLLIIETYNFRLQDQDKCLLFYELCRYLEEKHFHPIDMIDPMFRPKDQVLWQMDIFFAREDRPEFRSNTYR